MPALLLVADYVRLELQEDVDYILRIHIVARGRHGKLREALQNIQGATKNVEPGTNTKIV